MVGVRAVDGVLARIVRHRILMGCGHEMMRIRVLNARPRIGHARSGGGRSCISMRRRSDNRARGVTCLTGTT